MNRLKELRKENKQNQEDIAKYLNVTQVSYGRYELGTSEPTIETLIKLANFYNVTIDYLVGRDFNNDIGYLSDNERQLLDDFRKLSPLNQIKVLSEIKGFLMAQN